MSIDQEKIKSNILELCSESEYGSWEFWTNEQVRSEDQADLIAETIIELVKEKSIFPTEHKFVKDQSYQEVPLDEDRLRKEARASINTENIDSDTFYWFLATEKGQKEDIASRSV